MKLPNEDESLQTPLIEQILTILKNSNDIASFMATAWFYPVAEKITLDEVSMVNYAYVLEIARNREHPAHALVIRFLKENPKYPNVYRFFGKEFEFNSKELEPKSVASLLDVVLSKQADQENNPALPEEMRARIKWNKIVAKLKDRKEIPTMQYLETAFTFAANNGFSFELYQKLQEIVADELERQMNPLFCRDEDAFNESRANCVKLVSKNITFLTSIKPESKIFQSVPSQTNQNNPSIDTLNMTVVEFNEKYKDQYHIKEDNSYASKGFWTVHNVKEKECGVFNLSNSNNTLRETPFSLRSYNFIGNLQQKSFDFK